MSSDFYLGLLCGALGLIVLGLILAWFKPRKVVDSALRFEQAKEEAVLNATTKRIKRMMNHAKK